MGTSRSVPPSPKWTSGKTAATNALNDGPITPVVAQELMSQFVGQMCDAGNDEGFGKVPATFGHISPQEATLRLGQLTANYPVSSAGTSSSTGSSGGSGGGPGRGASRATGGRARASGGGRSSSISGTGIRPTAQRVATFLADVRKVGIVQALADRGIANAEKLPPDKLALAIADILEQNSSHIIETELRDALGIVFEKICEQQDTLDGVEIALDAAASDITTVLSQLFECYIIERFKTIHGEHLAGKHGFEAADKIVKEARDYVAGELALERSDRRDLTEVDWAGKEGGQIVNAILERTIAVYIETDAE